MPQYMLFHLNNYILKMNLVKSIDIGTRESAFVKNGIYFQIDFVL